MRTPGQCPPAADALPVPWTMTTLMFRSPHWMAPRHLFGRRIDAVIMTRFFEVFLLSPPEPLRSPFRES
jgi:hypothetical protein